MAALLAFWPSGLNAQADPSTLDDLFDLFDIDDVPADFVLVIDTSGSMMDGDPPPYPSVLDAYAALIDAIPAGDHLSVVTFDAIPELRFNGPVTAEGREAARLVLPDVAFGFGTDVGSAIESALRRLDRADANEVSTVIFLTDGLHEPLAGSRFPTSSGEAWSELSEQAVALERGRQLQVFGIGLEAEGPTDVDLLRTVFSSPEIVSLPPGQLAEFFQDAVRRSQLERLRLRIDEELENGVRIVSSSSDELDADMEIEIVFESTFERLPVSVSVGGAGANNDGGLEQRVTALDRSPIRIVPGEQVAVRFRLEPQLDSAGFTFPEVTEEVRFFIDVDGTYTVQPTALLERVTLSDLTGLVEGSHRLDAERSFGWSLRRLASAIAIGLVMVMVIVALYRRFVQVPRLKGVLDLGDRYEESVRIVKLKGKRQVIGVGQVPGAGTAKLSLRTRRGKPGRVFASVKQPQFYEEIRRGTERTVTDEVELQFNTYYRLGAGRFQYRPRAPARAAAGRNKGDS